MTRVRSEIGAGTGALLIGDHFIDQIPDRVERYVRCCLSLHRYDVRNSLHHQLNADDPQAATRLMRHSEAYLRV